MTWSLLVKNGTVIDGSGSPGMPADVAVEHDRIVAVGRNLAGEAARIVDARGLMVAPGFIDVHSHSDPSTTAAPRPSPRCARG